MFDITLFNSLTIPMFELEPFLRLLFRFLLNVFFAYMLIGKIYFKINKQRDSLFTIFVFNILIFFVASVLAGVKMKTGFAFGLFAIFSILRYRTEQVNIKEMTFLFASIILAVTNSLVTIKVPLANILFANIAIIGTIYILEKTWVEGSMHKLDMVFDEIELIHKDKRVELLARLSERTGLTIIEYDIIEINYLRDTAKMIVFYK